MRAPQLQLLGEAQGLRATIGGDLARSRATELRAAGLPLLIDCGAADEYLLHEGAAYLHDVLDELRVPHEYRLVEGAGTGSSPVGDPGAVPSHESIDDGGR